MLSFVDVTNSDFGAPKAHTIWNALFRNVVQHYNTQLYSAPWKGLCIQESLRHP